MTTPKAPKTPAAPAAPKDFSHINDDFYSHAYDSNDPDLLHHIATHPDSDYMDKGRVAENPAVSEATMRHLHDNVIHGKYEDGTPILSNNWDRKHLTEKVYNSPNCPKDIIEDAHDRLSSSDFMRSNSSHIAFSPKVDHHKITTSFKLHTNNFEDISGDEHEDAVRNYAKHPGTTSEHMQKFVDHPDKEIRRSALHSPNLTLDQQKKIWSSKDFDWDDKKDVLESHEHFSPDFMNHTHDELRNHLNALSEKMKNKGVGEDDFDSDSEYRDAHGALESALKHKNTPKNLLDHYSTSKNDDLRSAVLHNPSFDRDKLHELSAKGDKRAMSAFWEREANSSDIPQDHMRKLHSLIPADNKKYASRHQDNLISHPSTPDDVLKERSEIGAYAAQEVLKRPDLSPDVLNHIITKGGKSAALAALDHPNVNSDVIETALKRKMSDVNKKASLHKLAPKESKYEKFLKDEKTAHEGFDKLHDDPEYISRVADKFQHDPKMKMRLLSNKHIGPNKFNKIMGDLAAKKNAADADKDNAHIHFPESEQLERFGRDILSNQANIDAEGRKHIMRLLPDQAHKLHDLTSEEMKMGLDHWNSKAQEKASEMGAELLRHKNLSPDVAHDLLTGVYGKVEAPTSYTLSGNLAEAIHKNPHIYTPDVLRAGLSTRPEFMDPKIAHLMASAPQFAPNNWDQIIDALDPRDGGDSNHKAVFNEVLSGMFKNPNIDQKNLLEGLKSDDWHSSAIENPALTKESLLEHVGGLTSESKHKFSSVAKELSKRKLIPHALKAVKDPRLASEIMERVDYSDRAKMYDKYLDTFAKSHKDNPEILKDILKNRVGYMENNSLRSKVADSLFDHPDNKVRAAAYKWMSDDKRQEYVNKHGSSDPDLISGMDRDQVRSIKVHNEMPGEAVRAVIQSSHATHDQFKAAITHPDAEAAHEAVRRSLEHARKSPYITSIKKGYRNEKKEMIRKENQESIKEAQEMNIRGKEILDMAIKHHAKNDDIMSTLYGDGRHGKDLDFRSEMMNHPDISHKVKAKIINGNTHIFGKEMLEPYKDSLDEDMVTALADHQKIDKDMYNHITKNIVSQKDPKSYKYSLSALAQSPHLEENPEGAEALASLNDEDVNVHLVDNVHVDKSIKERLLKDPNVLLRASGSETTDEHLDKLLSTHAPTDPKLYSKIASHSSSTDDLRSKVIKLVGKHMSDHEESGAKVESHPDHEHYINAIEEALSSLSREKKVHGEAQQVIGKYGSEHSVNQFLAMKSGRTVDDKFPEIVAERFHDGIRPGKVESLLNLRFKNPNMSKKLIIEAGQAGNFGHIASHLTRNKLDDHAHDIAYNSLKDSPDDNYDSGKANLLRTFIEKSHAGITGELLDAHPDLIALAANNKRIDGQKFKDSFHGFVDRIILNNDSNVHGGSLKKVLDNPHIDSEDISKSYDKTAGKTGSIFEYLHEAIAKNSKTPSETIEKMWNDNPHDKNGALGDDLKKHKNFPKNLMHEHLLDSISSKKEIDDIVFNPNFRIKDYDHAIDALAGNQDDDSQRSDMYSKLSGSDHAHPDDLSNIYQRTMEKNSTGEITSRNYSKTIENLIDNPNTPEDILMKMREGGLASDEELMKHPVVGGKIFRSYEHNFPDGVPNLQKGNQINRLHYKPKQEKYQTVINMMNDEGMDWATFKKQEPKLSADPDIQKMFTSQPKQRLTKEAGQKYFEQLPGNSFHVSYRNWTGMQRHDSNVDQLVMQINNSEEHDIELKKDPNLHKLYKLAQAGSNGSGHPCGPHTVAWSRIDTSNKDHWFIDEAQSDMNSSLSRILREVEETGQAGSLQSRYGLTPDQAEMLVPKLQEVMRNWEKAALNGIIELARKHGVKRISMHSGESKTAFNKPGEEVTNKYNKIYNEAANAVGINKKVPYSTVPNHNKAKGSAPIWTMALDGSDIEETKKSVVSFDIGDLIKSAVQLKKKK